MASTSTMKQSKDEGKQYVLVGAEDESIPSDTTPNSPPSEKQEETDQCPDILYKVQYKDFAGEIKGTKELAAPYQLKKTK